MLRLQTLMPVKRREFLKLAGGAAALSAARPSQAAVVSGADPGAGESAPAVSTEIGRAFNGDYRGELLNQIAFPLGGIGAGMFCVEGTGTLSNFSLRHRPQIRESLVFAAVAIHGTAGLARALEGPVPKWKLHPEFPGQDGSSCTWGLPRFHEARFEARFPFAAVQLADESMPLSAALTAWSPFSPGDTDNASLPVAGLEYCFTNTSSAPVAAVFAFNAENILAQAPEFSAGPNPPSDRIQSTAGGFLLYGAGRTDRPWDKGHCAIWIDDPGVEVNHAWALDMLEIEWRRFAAGQHAARPPYTSDSAAGASIYLPFTLAPGEARTVVVKLAWYVPESDVYQPIGGFVDGKRVEYPRPSDRYRPWYAGRFANVNEVIEYWRAQYTTLRVASERFSRTFHDSTLPAEVIEAVAANLCILKSPTLYRQTDGRLWGWEGCTVEMAGEDLTGISGTSTHVWNYAQSIAHLFPSLERSLRETEFFNNQNDQGLQYCRTPLPIRPVIPGHQFPDGSAADGQLGAIINVFREWRIGADTGWLGKLWPRVRASLDYCIRTWDPQHQGAIQEPHLTTYDADLWGADSFCTSLYIGALQAAVHMGTALDQETRTYAALLAKAVRRMETQLFNGEFFLQDTNWQKLRAAFPPENGLWRTFIPSSDWPILEKAEGPPFQYGAGCLSDGVMGVWLSLMSGMDLPLDTNKVASHLAAVYRNNFRRDLTSHANFTRPFLACGAEAGVIVCTWPNGKRPSVSMLHSDELFTGIEYQVASHLIAIGKVKEGLEIVRAVRHRYDGRVRNPFCEAEAGYWYARAMSSYALLQALSGARYDAVDRVLHLKPALSGDFRSFLSTATGYGTVGVRDGTAFVDVLVGEIPYSRIDYTPAP